MKKIISSFLVIALIVCSITVSAYALFSSTATVSGLTFSTGSANLQISNDGINWSNNLDSSPIYKNMNSDFSASQEFYLKNSSLSDIFLGISVQLIDTTPGENLAAWNIIGDKINLTFQREDDDGTFTDIVTKTLSQWRDTGLEIDSLNFDTSHKYQMSVTTNNVSDNEAGKTLSNLSLRLTGVQQ
jgi:hypothetical protein